MLRSAFKCSDNSQKGHSECHTIPSEIKLQIVNFYLDKQMIEKKNR